MSTLVSREKKGRETYVFSYRLKNGGIQQINLNKEDIAIIRIKINLKKFLNKVALPTQNHIRI